MFLDAVALTFDPQTANEYLYLSENNTVAVRKMEKQQLPANDERFDKINQVLCCQPLSGRCFFTVEVTGTDVQMGVACKGIKRKGASDAVRLGRNKMSWSLCCLKMYVWLITKKLNHYLNHFKQSQPETSVCSWTKRLVLFSTIG